MPGVIPTGWQQRPRGNVVASDSGASVDQLLACRFLSLHPLCTLMVVALHKER